MTNLLWRRTDAGLIVSSMGQGDVVAWSLYKSLGFFDCAAYSPVARRSLAIDRRCGTGHFRGRERFLRTIPVAGEIFGPLTSISIPRRFHFNAGNGLSDAAGSEGILRSSWCNPHVS